MYQLSIERRATVIHCLVEGNSIRATCRLTGSAKNTVTRLVVEVGEACRSYQHRHLRNLSAKRIQCDEIWSFCGAKQERVDGGANGVGDLWTWTAMDADTKLMVCWHVGKRDFMAAPLFVADLKSRLATRVQLTTDGLACYRPAVEEAFHWNGMDFAQLVKVCAGSARTVTARPS